MSYWWVFAESTLDRAIADYFNRHQQQEGMSKIQAGEYEAAIRDFLSSEEITELKMRVKVNATPGC